MTLIKQSIDYNINGFEDVITGTNCGCTHNSNLSKFIKIIHLPQHWVCVSNVMRSATDAAIVYDSSHALNMNKQGKMRYDCSIEKAVCELISPKSSSIIMDVADVEQQKGGNDCGLFAIAYAALLSKRKDLQC